ncbi:MAG: fumarylacetoacetate hydrolase family protein [Paludibacteraceae bacterium]|nr:fumarylacetoacetate hydrolase family protein [Paludibacteraceae bacterium]MBR2261357.1 fumarylacetoacetate hydrolase family protein [Paludibacteraceae bacterium]MEE3484322.1 fumarylacetoacetate hydrolase family protein [Bacteroidales bacterium]
MKIIAVGWNYAEHNKELNRINIPEHPVIFMKPETALVRDNKPFYLPNFSNRIEYETEIILRISKMGKNISAKFADRYYDAIGLGIDFTARDLQNEFKAKGAPWEICKGFDNSAPISNFLPKEEFDINNLNFSLNINGEEVQRGNTKDMIFKVNDIIAYISQFFTLKTGDIIFTGTPVGVGPVKIGDHLEGYIEHNKMIDFSVC